VFGFTLSEKIKKEFEEKILETIDALYNLAMQLTRNRQDAEDLVQETAMRAYRYFHRFERGSNFKAWIMTILRNLYINKYRKKLKEPVRIEFEEVENFISLSEISGVQEEIFTEIIRSSIDKLPEELRMVITLFYVEGFTYKEIAKITEVPLGTVMSRLYTARQILKKQLSKSTLKEAR
jgi:RNA polymerase sigma-70 factor (ECF subfamily)